MTQSTTDPWAAAQAAPVQTQTPASGNGESSLIPPQPEGEQESLLFTQGSAAPSLFNKTHPLGTERTGIITKAPYDRQDQDFNTRQLKYWSISKCGGEQKNRAITTDAIDPPTGKPNRPVMSAHLELQTEYRMTEQEILAVGGARDVSFAQRDDGSRVLVVSGKQPTDAFREAIATAAKSGIQITKGADLVGLKLTAKRVGQTPNPGGNPSWVMAFKIERP